MQLDHSTSAIHHTAANPASGRTIALCSATRQTIVPSYSRFQKAPAARIGPKCVCIHQACLYLHRGRDMQQYSNLARTDTRSHGDVFPTLPLPTPAHRQTSLPRSRIPHTSGIESIFIRWIKIRVPRTHLFPFLAYCAFQIRLLLFTLELLIFAIFIYFCSIRHT